MQYRFLILLSLLLVRPALAEIRRCPGGVFSNKECPGEVVLSEKPHVPLTAEEKERREKSKWLNSLSASQSRAQRRYGLESSVGPISDLCEKSSVDQCREAVEEKERELNTLIAKIEAEREEKREELPEPEENSTTSVTIIQNHDYHIRGRRRHRDWPPYQTDPYWRDPYTRIRPIPELEEPRRSGPELPQPPPTIYHSEGREVINAPPAR